MQVPQEPHRLKNRPKFPESTEFRHDIGFRMPLSEPNDRPEFPEKPRFRHSAKGFRVSALPFEAKEAPPPPEEAPRFRAKRGFRDDASGHYRPTNQPNHEPPPEPPRLRPPQGGWAVMGLWRGMKRWMPLSVSADIKGHGLFIPHLCQPLNKRECCLTFSNL